MTTDIGLVFGNMDLLWLILALAGGAFGAMIGGNWSFGFTGIAAIMGLGILASTGSSAILDYVAFGPVFGPHIAFAGGAAAAAYAAKKQLLPGGANGKDVNTPLVSLSRPDVLLVGAGFGAFGYVLEKLIALIPWFGTHTDTVALTVLLSNIVARLMFGKTGIFHKITKPNDSARWLEWQEEPKQVLTLGVFAGLFAGGIGIMLGNYFPPENNEWVRMIDNSHILPWAISAICIFMVAAGIKFPVTHHITIIAALAGARFWLVWENAFLALLMAVIFGVLAAFLCELVAKLMYNHGDTHIDPPAGAIFILNTATVSLAGALMA